MRKDNPLASRTTYAYWIKERIRWSDTDMIGHVNNLAISAYVESGRSEFMRPIMIHEVNPRALMVLAKLTVNFLGEVHWPGDVDVGTVVMKIGRSSCIMGHGLFDGERCVSTAESVIVMIDEATRKSCEIPGWVRDYLSRFTIAKR